LAIRQKFSEQFPRTRGICGLCTDERESNTPYEEHTMQSSALSGEHDAIILRLEEALGLIIDRARKSLDLLLFRLQNLSEGDLRRLGMRERDPQLRDKLAAALEGVDLDQLYRDLLPLQPLMTGLRVSLHLSVLAVLEELRLCSLARLVA
jgi:hypothetical protein